MENLFLSKTKQKVFKTSKKNSNGIKLHELLVYCKIIFYVLHCEFSTKDVNGLGPATEPNQPLHKFQSAGPGQKIGNRLGPGLVWLGPKVWRPTRPRAKNVVRFTSLILYMKIFVKKLNTVQFLQCRLSIEFFGSSETLNLIWLITETSISVDENFTSCHSLLLLKLSHNLFLLPISNKINVHLNFSTLPLFSVICISISVPPLSYFCSFFWRGTG